MQPESLAPQTGDPVWASLVSLEPVQRSSRIRERFAQLLTLSDREMDLKINEMVVGEYTLGTGDLHTLTASRLRGLLQLVTEDPEGARRLQRAYDRVLDHLPGGLAMRHTVVVQTVARNELDPQEVESLRELFPSLLEQLPRPATSATLRGATELAAPEPQWQRRSWWKFW